MIYKERPREQLFQTTPGPGRRSAAPFPVWSSSRIASSLGTNQPRSLEL